ncbi:MULTISPECIES: hypothetical protein [unclassified Rhizobium]|uniref:hypothetical protein n=1 Tax=unclassified Rhizobium TaxID=2613769 RepID=UPI002478BA1E|nr:MULTISPECIES: hypothetical protein [unclassified Rhizobium]
MRDKIDRWAFLFRRSKWPNRVVLLFCGAVFVSLLFQAFAITIPSPSLWRDVVNAGRETFGFEPINPWRDWLYDFQSLIGGILAVIAAAFTVLQMRISDDRSETLHKQARKLQLRGDGLRFERMYFALHTELNRSIPIFTRSIPTQQVELKQWFNDVSDACSLLDRAFKAPTYEKASDLLDGALTNWIADIRTDIAKTNRNIALALQSGYAEEPPLDNASPAKAIFLRDLGRECNEMRFRIAYLIRELQTLYNWYNED